MLRREEKDDPRWGHLEALFQKHAESADGCLEDWAAVYGDINDPLPGVIYVVVEHASYEGGNWTYKSSSTLSACERDNKGRWSWI